MKTTRKVLLITLAALLFISSVAATPYQVRQVLQVGQSTTLSIGRAGATWGPSYQAGTAILTRWSYGPLYHSPKLSFRTDMAYVRFIDANGYNLRVVLGPVYVFFVLSGTEVKLWKMGMISIYFFNHATKTWSGCPTYQVMGASNVVRIACRITDYGLYALGTPR